jgi:hypothetical protein
MEFPHLERPRERRVLLVAAAGMVSKRRRQGKRGNILLAMPQARFSRAFEFHPAKFEHAYGGASIPAGAPAVWLTNRESARSSPERHRGSLVRHLL